MYTNYFGFSEKPFKLKPDVQQLFNATYAQKCYAEVVRGLLGHLGTLIVYGEAGCGKTSLIEKCSVNLADVVRFVRISNSHLSADDILQLLSEEVGLPPLPTEKPDWQRKLRESLFARQQQQGGRGVVLVVDDAHGLNEDCLDALLDFAAATVSGQRVMQLLLVGLPELANRCRGHSSSPTACHLDSLTSTEIGPYIQHQLKVAGYRGDALFTTDAIRTVAVHAGGIPRRINALCDAALFAASMDERRSITSQMVVDAVEHSFLRDTTPGTMAPPLAEPPVADHRVTADQADTDASQDLTNLAADVEATLEQALTVAGGGASASASRDTPKKSASRPPRRRSSSHSRPPTQSPTAEAPSTKTAATARKVTPRTSTLVGMAATLAVAIGVGGWQWYQRPPLTEGVSLPREMQQAAMETPVEAMSTTASPDQVASEDLEEQSEVAPVQAVVTDEPVATASVPGDALPQSLELPPPVNEAPTPRGLPPLDPQDPFAARPLQATHQFLDARGEVFRKELD